MHEWIAGGVRAQMCVTSPPYWGLRDYGVDGQLGLEPTIGEYVANMVEVFRLVRELLADDGTLWLNLGDSYAAKSLCGIPWRVAFALQADGWYLRSDIIWHKPNPMPESITDRPTKSHEYVFLMSKSERYFYDAEAVREPAQYGRRDTAGKWRGVSYVDQKRGQDNSKGNWGFNSVTGKHPETGRNRRTVWTIPTAPFPEAHFATFPPALVEPCILAGCPHKCCAKCGAPWVREVERPQPPENVFTNVRVPADGRVNSGFSKEGKKRGSGQKYQNWLNDNPPVT